MMTERERIAAQLEMAENTGADPVEIGRLQGELSRLNEINEEARPAVEAMDHRERERQQAEQHAAMQRQNREEREFNEALERHRLDRLEAYRLTTPGLPEAVFDRDIWPELRAAYLAGEPDAVDLERLERADHVF